MRRNSSPDRSSTCRRIRRSDVWLSTVIDVKERSLSTFEQDFFIRFAGFGQLVRRLADKWPQTLDQRSDLFEYLIRPQRLIAEKNDDAVRFFQITLDAQL